MTRCADIADQRFGRLVALEFVGRDKHKDALYRCACDCGAEITVRRGNLMSGQTQSCRCAGAGPRARDMVGTRYGRLVAVERDGCNRRGDALWRCQCDCGGFKIVPRPKLKKGQVRSCGCLRRGRPRSDPRHDLNRNRQRLAVEQRLAGTSIRAIAKRVGVRRETVSAWLRKAGIQTDMRRCRRETFQRRGDPAASQPIGEPGGKWDEIDAAIMRARLEAGMIDGRRRVSVNPWPSASSLA